ncbi:MAG TPA: polyprenyl synthetase family protein [Lacipirellulaceae bacterium]|jgi:geranylgeranyl pyrophosphate synthase|nr:polyprenyl synthetase family protein [Lacipirellulaceae bacterium]
MTPARQDAPSTEPPRYAHLLRVARQMFEPDELERLIPRARGGPRLEEVNGEGAGGLDPIAATEAIAYDFLAKGGKYSRPFITLAAYDALTSDAGAHADDINRSKEHFSDVVRRAAISIESFHKASLVHDDIQDGDEFRYGRPTLHIAHGVPTAINVGDYLIGLGYRLVSRDTVSIGAEAAADILNKLADAHTKLSEGQGAELVWRDSRNKRLSPNEALKIYALKTAPAFEAALYSGLRLAGPAEKYAEPAAQLAKHLGIAFQILNDLQDWQGDDFNKLTLGGDVLGGRPTVLWALALEGLGADDRRELEQLVAEGDATPAVFKQIRTLFQQAGVFTKALKLVDEHRQKAVHVANNLAPEALRRLAHHLIDTVLQQPAATGDTCRPLAVPAR